jgi:WD40 repeat protein
VTYDDGGGHAISQMATTCDNKYLFLKCGKQLRQYQIDGYEIVKEYQFNKWIKSMVTTFDNKRIFVGLNGGSLHQICIDSQRVIKDYGNVHTHDITSMAVTRDNNFLITGGLDKRVKKISIIDQELKISIIDQELVKDFGKICFDWIQTIQLTPCDKRAFVYDYLCGVKLIDLISGKTVKDHGRVHRGYSTIQGILATRDEGYLLTSSSDGTFKQWSVRERALVQDFGQLLPQIWCICD